jgi:hypothetical protein
MRTATNVVQILTRLTWLIQLVTGLLFWFRVALPLIPLHMLDGLVFVILIWVMAGLAVRAGVDWRMAAFAAAWGVVVVVLGMTQNRLMPGSFHWVIQVIHLLAGVVGMGVTERMAAAIKRLQAPASAQAAGATSA